ncbi:hypothetical protein AWC38_SpisGene23882 [Stylophora pistillata]|uniref:Schlafen AlbA-2 domain-containing protein n=1 Tax=Stylophora pistillata TaxID=50429 RepID=A0A2B4R729_STYPI|nr:hypothetical protein AWC38_SpisGene23882 [Stylophora pistillata]
MKMANESFTSRLIININDLLRVHRVEKQRVEFKASWNTGGTSFQILHSITAFGNDFLNDNGGYIIIGIEDEPSEDGQVQVCGVPSQDLDNIQRQINGLCKGNIKPPYYPILSPEIYNEKHVLVIWATASENGPHECRKSDRGEFQFYIRRGPQTLMASPGERTQLLLQHNKTPFDDRMAGHIVQSRKYLFNPITEIYLVIQSTQEHIQCNPREIHSIFLGQARPNLACRGLGIETIT